eukprot:5060520-Alexandrium_andersonii.AAC.1
MCAGGAQLGTDLFHGGPGSQGVGHGSKRAALVKARGGLGIVSLAAGIPPEVCRWPGVPGVE